MQTTIKPRKPIKSAPLGLLLVWLCVPAHSAPSTEQAEPPFEPGTAIPPPAPESAAPMAATPAPEPAAPTTPPTQSEHILRALLTTGIANREPVDEVVSVDKNSERIYFFTELSGLKGKSIKHRWVYQGNIMGEVSFNVGSNKWRCYSSKNLIPKWTGIWTVSVVDDNDNVLTETYFEVTE